MKTNHQKLEKILKLEKGSSYGLKRDPESFVSPFSTPNLSGIC